MKMCQDRCHSGALSRRSAWSPLSGSRVLLGDLHPPTHADCFLPPRRRAHCRGLGLNTEGHVGVRESLRLTGREHLRGVERRFSRWEGLRSHPHPVSVQVRARYRSL